MFLSTKLRLWDDFQQQAGFVYSGDTKLLQHLYHLETHGPSVLTVANALHSVDKDGGSESSPKVKLKRHDGLRAIKSSRSNLRQTIKFFSVRFFLMVSAFLDIF